MTFSLPILDRFGLTIGVPEVFDHQVTGTYLECERMAYYLHILGRRLTRENSVNLVWGTIFHSAAEAWHTTHDADTVVAVIEGAPWDAFEGDRYGRNMGRMMELFIAWNKYQQDNPIRFLRTEQSVMVTCPPGNPNCPYFPGVGCDLTYGGRMDRVVEWQSLRGPLDYKTTVMDEQDPLLEYRPNHQFEGYDWAASHLMGEHCWGVIVERLVCNKSKIDIRRYPVPYSRDMIREWVRNEHATHAEIREKAINHGTDEGKWKQNYHRCSKPYMCAFREVCLSPHTFDFRLKWLRDNTIERRWDFTNPSGEKSGRTAEGPVPSLAIVTPGGTVVEPVAGPERQAITSVVDPFAAFRTLT